MAPCRFRLAATTTYTISVTGPGGSKTASATVTVFSGIRYYAYIPDFFDKKIRIIDTNTGAICKTIEIARTNTNLQGVSTDSSGVFAYVADTGTTRIIQIDPLTMAKVNELSTTANFQGKAQAYCRLRGRMLPLCDQQRPHVGSWCGKICGQYLRDKDKR